jgi:hypothetical protein
MCLAAFPRAIAQKLIGNDVPFDVCVTRERTALMPLSYRRFDGIRTDAFGMCLAAMPRAIAAPIWRLAPAA